MTYPSLKWVLFNFSSITQVTQNQLLQSFVKKSTSQIRTQKDRVKAVLTSKSKHHKWLEIFVDKMTFVCFLIRCHLFTFGKGRSFLIGYLFVWRHLIGCWTMPSHFYIFHTFRKKVRDRLSMMLEKKFHVTSFDPLRNSLFVFLLIDGFVVVTVNQSNYDPSKFQPIRDQRFIYISFPYQKKSRCTLFSILFTEKKNYKTKSSEVNPVVSWSFSGVTAPPK